MGEFERELIRERVRAGLRNAAAKGKKLGRPRVNLDAERIDALRAQGLTNAQIADRLGVSQAHLYKAFADSRATSPG